MSGHLSDPHTVPPRASRWQQLADRIITEQQHKEPEPTGCRGENQPMESSSDSSTAVTHHDPLPPSPHRPLITPLDRPPSRRNSRPPTPTEMMLSSAINFYEQTINDPSIAVPTILKQARYEELYVYFAYELPLDLTWGETQAGNNYIMRRIRGLPADDILQYEAEWNARFLWNSLHRQNVMEEFPPYEEEAREIKIQEPMPDAPPVAPAQAPIGAFSYIRGQAPPGTYAPGYQPFAGGGRGGGGGGGGGQPAQPPQPPAPPPRYVLPRYPAPPQMPDPPVPWQLVDGAVAPYDEFKPKILKEVDDFKGDSDDITRFFLKCELHFDLFNRHYRHPPHKVIFCVSRLADDAGKWWELSTQQLGKAPTGEQLYPNYEDFKTALTTQFWKDANEQLKYAQWEKLRQVDFKDGDKFFQQFEEFTYHAGIHTNDQLMLHQIKKAARQMSKNMIYSADGDVPTNYDEWKARLTRIDLNWRLKQAEGITPATARPQTQKTTIAHQGWPNSSSCSVNDDGYRDNIWRTWRADGHRHRQGSSGNSKVLWMWRDRPLQMRLPQASENPG